MRSIPACAGEPPGTVLSRPLSPVYPRVCGGTARYAARVPFWKGLSPRVRGNPQPTKRHSAPARSIPACAGEPYRGTYNGFVQRVYPRVCGGTERSDDPAVWVQGLSPRVRGNQSLPGSKPQRSWSIPACAGEPQIGRCGAWAPTVYPRVCGGTVEGGAKYMSVEGLSPRVRGNPVHQRIHEAAPRSIPACAGEPSWSIRFSFCLKVYPRVCGGTSDNRAFSLRLNGLSPRVRGNQLAVHDLHS